MLFSGCDFFRSLVGKPTSEDLERMRQEAVEQERQRRQDSIDKARALALAQAEAEAAKQDQLAGTGRYHVILGSFKVEESASVFSIVNRSAKLFSFVTGRFLAVCAKAGTYSSNVFIRLCANVWKE